MLLPAATGTGLSVFVIDRLAESATPTLAVALLFVVFGSLVVDETESVSLIVVPCATLAFTVTVKVKFAVVFAARDAVVQLGGVVAVLHVQPAGPVSVPIVVFAGSGSVKETVDAAIALLLVTLCVYVIVLPAVTGFGLAEFVTLRSACVAVATPIVDVAVLLARFESRDVVATVAVSVIVPVAVAFTL
jgi:hypothetical protein